MYKAKGEGVRSGHEMMDCPTSGISLITCSISALLQQKSQAISILMCHVSGMYQHGFMVPKQEGEVLRFVNDLIHMTYG